jgi:hypothetical protein
MENQNDDYNDDLYIKEVEVKTSSLSFIIGQGQGIDSRTLYIEIVQRFNTDVITCVGIEYGWNKAFLNKISEEFKYLISMDPKSDTTVCIDQEKWDEYGGIDFQKVIEKNVNQLLLNIHVPFKMSCKLTINNAATPEFLTKLSETFAELAEKETEYLVPDFARWSY